MYQRIAKKEMENTSVKMYLFMNQIGSQRVDEQIPLGGSKGKYTEIIKNKPFDGGDLALHWWQRGLDLDRATRRVIVVPAENENNSPIGKSKGMGVEGK